MKRSKLRAPTTYSPPIPRCPPESISSIPAWSTTTSNAIAESGISFDNLMALGRKNPDDRSERLSMAILALNTSAYRNAVSRLHRQVSQAMWQGLGRNFRPGRSRSPPSPTVFTSPVG